MAIALLGAALYIYKELVESLVKKGRPYVVEAVRKLNSSVAEVTLSPRDGRLKHGSGQFLFVRFPRTPGLQESHPFTISSAPQEDRLRLTIKASGDFTHRLVESLGQGVEARVEGGYGRFDYRYAGLSRPQIWVAGGIGLTPFLSWIRDFDGRPAPPIDFYYTVRVPEEALFMAEIEQAQAIQPGFRCHLHCSNQDGRLTVETIAVGSGPVSGKEIYLCGPFAMTVSLKTQFLRAGVPASRIHYEEFNFR